MPPAAPESASRCDAAHAAQVAQLTSGRLLARNSALNLAGHAAPMAAALVAIPLLIAQLGTDRFGLLTLAWALAGYFSLLDLGLGRALVKLVAERLGRGGEAGIPALVRAGIGLMALLGAASGLLLAGAAPWLAEAALDVPAPLRGETRAALYVLALTMPPMIVTSGLRGVLQAYQRFGFLNLVQALTGTLMFAAPLAAAFIAPHLAAVLGALLAIRAAALAAYAWRCAALLRGLPRDAAARERLGPMLWYGGWTTVSNVVSAFMVYFDRFLIGAMLGVGAVAYYTTPLELVARLGILPAALVGTIFPAFSTTFAHAPGHTARLLSHSSRYVLIALFPVALALVAGSEPGLRLWLGAEFAAQGCRALQWLAIGFLANGVAQMPFVMIQGAGRPDWTTWFQLAQLGPYLALLWLCTGAYGIAGAAFVWSLRMLVDAAGLAWLSGRLLHDPRHGMQRTAAALGGAAAFLAALMPLEGAAAPVAGAALLAAYAPAAWRFGLDPAERAWLRGRVRAPVFAVAPAAGAREARS